MTTQIVEAVNTERLHLLEGIIERGLNTFVDVGNALLEIRDSRMYRLEHNTFEDYCNERWGFNRAHAGRLIAAAEVAGNLDVSHGIQTPVTERQLRPLTRLEPDEQREVWERAIETAPNGKVTAAHVQQTVDEYKTPHVSHNSGNNEWYTPAPYIAAARAVMGSIDLDPASSDTANEMVEASTYYTERDDGLAQDWYGNVWMNPPYAAELVGRFANKLADAFVRGDVPEAIVLVNNATETAWFQVLIDVATAVVFPKSRVRFWQPDGTPGAPLQGQAVIYLGDNPAAFLRRFEAFGWGAKVWR